MSTEHMTRLSWTRREMQHYDTLLHSNGRTCPGVDRQTMYKHVHINLGIHQRGVQSEGGAVDGGSII